MFANWRVEGLCASTWVLLALVVQLPLDTFALAANDTDDPGYYILDFLHKYEEHLKEPVDMERDILCNCTGLGCDAEVVRMLGTNYSGICRATGSMCYKRVLRDQSVVLACLSHQIFPEMFCSAKKFLHDESIMECCSNQSFCNGALKIIMPDRPSDGTPLRVFVIVGAVVVAVLLVVVLVLALASFNKTVKRWIWRLNRQRDQQASADEVPLNQPAPNGLVLFNDLLGSLDESGVTSGSGSGYPLLVQRTLARQIELQVEVGKGRFGSVWLGAWKGEPVAVKIFNSLDERSWDREVEIFQTDMLRHPNVVRYIASDSKDTGMSTQLWLVTEYHAHGSLFDFISANTVTGQTMLKMIRGIANGLAFLHAEVPGMRSKPAIAHRDLKTKNILVKDDLSCVVADLGLAVRYSNGQLNMPDNTKCGTIRYLSPEVLSNNLPAGRFDMFKASDMYGFGLIVWEVARRCNTQEEWVQPYEVPYYEYVSRDPTFEEMQKCVWEEKKRPALCDFWNDDVVMSDVRRIMCECWTETPSKRLTAMNVRISVEKLANSCGWNITS